MEAVMSRNQIVKCYVRFWDVHCIVVTHQNGFSTAPTLMKVIKHFVQQFVSESAIPNFVKFFRAGQWVDFFIPGVEKVGGFSMWSPPSKLDKESKLDLAIKASTWPPANWVHTQAKIGSKLSIKIGKILQ
jgi:hypothetical protein